MVGSVSGNRIRGRRQALGIAIGVGVLLVAVSVAAVAATAVAASERRPTVIMISLDGTTFEQIERAGLEWIPRLIRRGAVATRLLPVFPSNTFPNHVSLVTGVLPEVHGIVNNAFLDPERGIYERSADPTWIQVEPLWAIVDRHGQRSASFHWVGSEGAWRNGHGPRHWKEFDTETPEQEKVEAILGWLDLEDLEDSPTLITAWFHGADGAGHRSGPNSRAVSDALREQDQAIGHLVEGLDARDAFATTTLLLVSDHGMLEVEETFDLEDLLDDAGIEARVIGGGGFAAVYTDGDADRTKRVVEAARASGMEAYRTDDPASKLRLDNPRFGDAVVVPPPGTSLHSGLLQRLLVSGVHGYRPETSGISGILIAVGRGIPPGSSYGEVRNIDVAPTLLSWLGIEPPDWMEGRPLVPPSATRKAVSR